MRRALLALARSAAWLAGLLTIVAVLHALGRGPLALPPASANEIRRWLAERDAVTVAMALARAGGMLLAGYLAATSALAMAGQALHLPGLVRAAEIASFPVVRRLTATVIGMSLGAAPASLAALPIAPGAVAVAARPSVAPTGMRAAASHRVVIAARPSFAPTWMRAMASDRVVVERLPDLAEVVMERLSDAPRPPPAAAVRAPVAAPRVPVPTTCTLRKGDHLWGLSARALGGAWGRRPSDAEVAPYWRHLIELNRARLADPANPDLVFPGQQVELPPPPPDPRVPAPPPRSMDRPAAGAVSTGERSPGVATLHPVATPGSAGGTAVLRPADSGPPEA
ncbi:MAG: hypothetical protein JWN46_1912 [Acidimicrobiales bacterium]|nr:hypothetical protein [Acidimicrobiales bacterium]